MNKEFSCIFTLDLGGGVHKKAPPHIKYLKEKQKTSAHKFRIIKN
jgi:hypothetical protein